MCKSDFTETVLYSAHSGHHNKAWSMLIFTAFSVLYRHIHPFIFLLIVIMAFEHFLKSCLHGDPVQKNSHILQSWLKLCSSPPITCFAAPEWLKGSHTFFLLFFLLSLFLPASQPEPKLTSRLHFQQVPPFITRQGCERGLGRGGTAGGQ